MKKEDDNEEDPISGEDEDFCLKTEIDIKDDMIVASLKIESAILSDFLRVMKY